MDGLWRIPAIGLEYRSGLIGPWMLDIHMVEPQGVAVEDLAVQLPNCLGEAGLGFIIL